MYGEKAVYLFIFIDFLVKGKPNGRPVLHQQDLVHEFRGKWTIIYEANFIMANLRIYVLIYVLIIIKSHWPLD